MWTLWLADTCLCFDEQPLSFAAGDTGGESGGGDEVVPRDVYPAVQQPEQALGASVSGALQGAGGGRRVGRLFFDGGGLYPPESGAGETV